MLRLFVTRCAQVAHSPATVTPAGVTLGYHSERERAYGSLFGAVPIERPYFYERGQGGSAPLDGLLSLPEGKWSDLVREWTEELAMGRAYHAAVGVLARFMGGLSTRELATAIETDARLVPAFYAQQPPPSPQTAGPLLVLQADGKGVSIPRPAVAAKARLGKGENPGGKKEAILTAL